MFVFERYLSLLAATGVYRIYLVWHLHRVPSSYQAVACESYGFVVVLSVGYTRYFFLFQVGSVYLGFAVPYTDEEDVFIVSVPHERLYTLVPAVGVVGTLVVGEVYYYQTVLVRFAAVVLHR